MSDILLMLLAQLPQFSPSNRPLRTKRIWWRPTIQFYYMSATADALVSLQNPRAYRWAKKQANRRLEDYRSFLSSLPRIPCAAAGSAHLSRPRQHLPSILCVESVSRNRSCSSSWSSPPSVTTTLNIRATSHPGILPWGHPPESCKPLVQTVPHFKVGRFARTCTSSSRASAMCTSPMASSGRTASGAPPSATSHPQTVEVLRCGNMDFYMDACYN